MTQINITWEEIKDLIPKRTSLTYVDYRDSLDEHTELISECIKAGNDDAIYEKSWEWFNEQEWESVQEYVKQVKSDIESRFDLGSDEAEDIIEQFRDQIEDTIRNNDDSDVLKDLWRNTSDQTMFYDTGYEVEDGSWAWNEERMNQEVKAIKKYLGISRNKKEWDKDLVLLIAQAGYGGQLVVYFYEDAEDFIRTDEFKTILFENFHLAIINTGNGSGHDMHMYKCAITLPFVKENLYLCKEVTYSYTFQVCGMSSNWCAETGVKFSTKLHKTLKLEQSHLAKVQAQNDEYEKTYRAGGCTHGDTNITRHRNTRYHNDPMYCRNECPSCKQIWLD